MRASLRPPRWWSRSSTRGTDARAMSPRDGQRMPTGFAVIALGKHGGAELNYSSDIDLCFVYEAEGETDGPEVVSNRAFFARVAEQLVGALTAMTEEGTVFRVDLRLRPEGTGGPLALPLAAYRAYHQTRGAQWERQALIKARVATGDERVGQAFLDLAREIVYRPGVEREALGEIRAMKNRIDRRSPRARAAGAPRQARRGGIRDIEFHIQALQLLYGGQDPWLRERQQPAGPPPARRAGVPLLGGVGAARARLHIPPDDRASPPAPARAPDAHAAG